MKPITRERTIYPTNPLIDVVCQVRFLDRVKDEGARRGVNSPHFLKGLY